MGAEDKSCYLAALHIDDASRLAIHATVREGNDEEVVGGLREETNTGSPPLFIVYGHHRTIRDCSTGFGYS